MVIESRGRAPSPRGLEALELLLGDEAARAERRGGGVGGRGRGGLGAGGEDLLGVSAQEGDAVEVLWFAGFFFFGGWGRGGGRGGKREKKKSRSRGG